MRDSRPSRASAPGLAHPDVRCRAAVPWSELLAVVHGGGARCVGGSIQAAGQGPLALRLSFLDPGRTYTATVYSDRDPGDPQSRAVSIQTLPVDAATVVEADMGANGGHAMRIVPASSRAATPAVPVPRSP